MRRNGWAEFLKCELDKAPSTLTGEGWDGGERVKSAKNNISLALSRSRQLRQNMTDAEKKLWRGLRKNQIYEQKFRRQFPIGKYIVDFICLEARLIVEVDGGQHQDQRKYDEKRDAWLKGQNFNVLRFWNNDVLENFEGVMAIIMNTLEPSAPPSQPSPARGEGGGFELTSAVNIRLNQ
jgi:very-short-patch-repair endonuclease